MATSRGGKNQNMSKICDNCGQELPINTVICSLCGERVSELIADNLSAQLKVQPIQTQLLKTVSAPQSHAKQTATPHKSGHLSRGLSKKTIVIISVAIIVVVIVGILISVLGSNALRSGPGREFSDQYITKEYKDCKFLDEKVDTKSGEAIYRYTRNVEYENMIQIQTISVSFSYFDKEKGWIHSGTNITSTEESWNVAGQYLCEGWNGIYHFAMTIVKINDSSVNVIVSDTNDGNILYDGDITLDAKGCKFRLNDNDYDSRLWQVFITPNDIYINAELAMKSFVRVD